MISMVDGTGSMDVMKVEDMTDGAIEVLTTRARVVTPLFSTHLACDAICAA